MPKIALKPNDPVRVRGCSGIARVEKFIRSHGVYLLDRPMSRRYADRTGNFTHVSYWTFEPKDLEKIVVEGNHA